MDTLEYLAIGGPYELSVEAERDRSYNESKALLMKAKKSINAIDSTETRVVVMNNETTMQPPMLNGEG